MGMVLAFYEVYDEIMLIRIYQLIYDVNCSFYYRVNYKNQQQTDVKLLWHSKRLLPVVFIKYSRMPLVGKVWFMLL